MKSNCIVETVAALFLSLSLGAQARIEIAGVDPENYVSKQVAADVAKGGIRKLKEQGVLSFNREKRKGNLRSLQGYFDDDQYYDAAGTVSGGSLDDDQLVTEELITIEYYQDNRFSSPDPIYADPTNPTREASGNRWLYANVPLQPIFGINDLPIAGLLQGYCESIFEDQDGFCHFTYEFFDLNDGAIVVYASITAEGSTRPQGPSVLNIIGGAGEFSGAVGEITLWPVGIDESIIPARIFKDGSLFLGNRNGFEAKFDVSVRYLLNAPIPVPVPVSMPVPAPITQAQAGVSAMGLATQSATRVECDGQIESEYCDCDMDCGVVDSDRCACAEAEACCEQR